MQFRALSSMDDAHSGRPVIVLVHGIGTSHRYLAKLHAALAPTVDVVSIDLPGFGGQPKSSTAPDVFRMADALGSVVLELGLTEVVLVGHSMGAQWVVETAILHPGLVRAVVLIGAVADDRHRSVGAQMRALTRDVMGEPPLANAVVLADYIRCGPVWFARHLRHMLAYPIEERLPLLAVPLLVVRGGNDPIAGIEWLRRLRDHARDARVVVVPGHRHNVQFTAPKAVASLIAAFLARVR